MWCFLLFFIVAKQHGSSLILLELRPAPTRQWSRQSLPSRRCLLLARMHHPSKHTRRQRKWCHVCQMCSKGISTTLDGIRPPLLQSAHACHDHRLWTVHPAHHWHLASAKDREKIGRGWPWAECDNTHATLAILCPQRQAEREHKRFARPVDGMVG